MDNFNFLILIGIALIILGFILIFVGIVHLAAEIRLDSDQEKGEQRVKSGGVILIGPLPIIFGTDKRSAIIVMILAIVLMLLAVLFIN